MGRTTVEPSSRGTVTVDVDEGTRYLVLHLPDGTTLDISIGPKNGRNHIKLYDPNDYSVMPLGEGSKIRDLEVWGKAARSNARGTTPENTVTLTREELVEE